MDQSAFAASPGFAILETTPSVIASVLAGATPEQLSWRPNEERWSIEMILAHLADVETHGFLSRFRALAERADDPFLPLYDQHAFFRTAPTFDARRDLEVFSRERTLTVNLLRSLPATVLERRGQHEELKQLISFGDLLHELAFHDLGHIRQIAEIYRSIAFYPKMGAFRDYYKINP
jgi:hypothetical protein